MRPSKEGQDAFEISINIPMTEYNDIQKLFVR